ncbi:hypothetical protein U0C82_09125 [Fulvimarina sp. 2208YS6-2-32]|uniref:Uncharacterized protein n=1 Tax=Fulvimarina uroteuthidis TaxID=3098149 RepID=A0ABU5I245_9HYPH|nr:hypothetical protein [Fulvimarina sp. 2208YS6-2-32]
MFSIKDRKNVDDELARLTGAYLNAIAIGVTLLGGVGPLFSVIYTRTISLPVVIVVPLSLVCFGGGILLHLGARRTLRRELSR